MWDSDKLNTVALDNVILSLGKLVRSGWSFYFESADKLVAVTPDKQSPFRVEFGDDDILRLPHELRSVKQAAPLPAILQQDINRLSAQVLHDHAKRVPEALNALLLHGIFLHRGMEKVYRTLLHTRGYVAQRLPDPFCWVCAQAKAQRRGLRTHAPLAYHWHSLQKPTALLECSIVLMS